jgi:predicted ATP-grasp superfamily ATP-dependent carboligase
MRAAYFYAIGFVGSAVLAMDPIKLRIPPEEAADFSDDLTAWAASTGIDPVPVIVNEPDTTNTSAPVLYQVYLSEGFFDQFPEWRMYIEQ